jgi:beta-glucosidase
MFSKDFVWGAATASYQIEGAMLEDGKGLSIWDTCCQIPNFIKNGDNADIACDHYHRYKDDVQLMKAIGLKAYRMSISWSRILPNGIGTVNEKGLEYYERLIDELLSCNIIPYVTIFHWDYPYELYKKGGWLNRDSSDWFAEYTGIVIRRLSDRVKHWITQNEPQCFIGFGHELGIHAPGLKLSRKDILDVVHNSLLAHGKSVMAIRSYSKQSCEIGYAPVGEVFYPETNSKEDIEAARKATFSIINPDLWNNTWLMDPIYFGHYPEDGLNIFRKWCPDIRSDDMKIINQPLDFFASNNYQGKKVRMGKDGNAEVIERHMGYDRTAFKWPMTPEILYWGPKYFYERYNKPILITENGISNTDWVSVDGKVHDPQRIDFLHRYLKEFKRAAKDGVKAKGYFCWSLMDNFEWAAGYGERFGLIYVDFKSQKRIIKDSGYWYKKVVESNAEYI